MMVNNALLYFHNDNMIPIGGKWNMIIDMFLSSVIAVEAMIILTINAILE